MKYRINRTALFALMAAVLLFVLRVMTVPTGNAETTATEVTKAQSIIDLFFDSLAILFALSISVMQSIQCYKTNKVSFWLNITALASCVLCLWNWPETELWQTYGTYLSLIIILVGLSVEPKVVTQGQEDEESKVRIVSKRIAGFLVAIMIAMAIISFIKGTPQFAISDGVIYLFLLVIVILAWDSVESLSLGSIVTLNKAVKDKEKAVKELTSENRELRTQILSIVQNKQMLNVEINNGKAPVEPNIQDDSPKKEMDLEFDKIDQIIEIDSRLNRAERYRHSIQYLLEKKMLSKFAFKNNISLKDIQMNVKFSAQFLESEPIRIRKVIFDAYTKRSLDELFIELKAQYPTGLGTDQLYYMLCQINRYISNNKANAKLVIIIPKLSDEGMLRIFGRKNKDAERDGEIFRERYMPAIKNGLLEIAEIEITDDELDEMHIELGIN